MKQTYHIIPNIFCDKLSYWEEGVVLEDLIVKQKKNVT